MSQTRAPAPSARGWVLLSIAAAGLGSAWMLELDPRQLVPGPGGWAVARELFGHALAPAWTYQAADLPAGIRPLPLVVLDAVWTTVRLAAVALGLSLVFGLGLGFLASSTTWGLASPTSRQARAPARTLAASIHGLARVLAALLRSTHELLWAVLLLAAFGLGQMPLVIALVLPYSGVFAKVFSEMLDEAPRDAALALQAAGAAPAQVFLFGLLPRALPDMGAYAFYRFECALRSSAVLGFFGYPTLGYYLAASFENLYYAEVWTYLYALLALVIVSDAWSGALRRRWLRR